MKSVIEKTRDSLVSQGQQDLVQKIDSMHKILQTKLNGGNLSSADKAEKFLNWLIFNKGDLSEKTLNSEYRNELLNLYPAIRNIQAQFLDFTFQSQQYNKRFSETTSKEMINELLKEYGSFAQKRGTKTEELFVKLVNGLIGKEAVKSTGTSSATVVVKHFNQKLLQQISEDGEEALKKLIKDSKVFRYAGKNMKSDVQGINVDYNISLQTPDENIKACFEVFSNVSIKSVNNIEKIHLENTDINKAYSAFINFAYSNKFMTQKTIKAIFNYYYGTDKGNENGKEYVTRHLNHLFRVYAYSGFGTSPLNDLNNISQGVKYLVVVDNVHQHIYVKSSSEVINFLLTHPTGKTLQPDIYLNLSALLNRKY